MNKYRKNWLFNFKSSNRLQKINPRTDGTKSRVFDYMHLSKSSEDCDKFSTRFLHKNLIAGTAIGGSAEKQTQCLSKCSAIAPLTAVGTFSAFSNASKVMEKFLHILQRHSEAEPKNPRKVQHNDWILHFAFAPFRMTIPAQALALILTFGAIGESQAENLLPNSGTCGDGCLYEITTDTTTGKQNLRVYNDPNYTGTTKNITDNAFTSSYEYGSQHYSYYDNAKFDKIAID